MGSEAASRIHKHPVHASEARHGVASRNVASEAVRLDSDPVGHLQRTAGNRAVTGLFEATRVAGATAPAATLVVQRGPGGGGAGAPTAAPASADDLIAAEAWIRYVALRGNSPAPTAQVPQRYRGALVAIQSAVGGPGPIPARELQVDDEAFGEARGVLGRLRADHDRLTPKVAYESYDLAEVAIDRGQANFRGGANTFEGGANQLDQGQILLAIWSAADAEVKAAKEAGYGIPKALADLGSDARAMLEAAKEGWTRKAPSEKKLTTPTDEIDLIEFMTYATETINGMRSRRAADMARARRREADALEIAAERQMVELHALLADKRRAAFMSGDEGMLEKVHSALGHVVSAINDTKAAAALITDKVDRINAVAELLSKKGTGLIELPQLPKGISDVAGKLESAHAKLGQVIELLELAGPAKTELDAGLKYLKGADMALEHFGGKHANPFLSVYVNSYLSPGIKNCMRSIGTIAGIMSAQNRSIIEAGDTKFLMAVDWKVEPGGEAAYVFLVKVFKLRGAAPLSDEAWNYLSDHRADLSASVGEAMPRQRRAVAAWAAKNRLPLWQSFYGSAKPPQ